MDTETLQAQLAMRRDELLRRAQRIDAHLNRDDPVPADFAEQATELENLDVLFALDRDGRQELARISATLERIAHGEYGQCMRCGRPIAEARLQALPTADTCIHCASAGEAR